MEKQGMGGLSRLGRMQSAMKGDTIKGKPDPEGLHMIQAQHPGTKLWYIGDTVDDARSARAAGVPFIGILSAQHLSHAETKQLFEQEGAVEIVENVNEIEGIV